MEIQILAGNGGKKKVAEKKKKKQKKHFFCDTKVSQGLVSPGENECTLH